jgi:hypothetical protein
MSLESSRENPNIYPSMNDASAMMATVCFNGYGLALVGWETVDRTSTIGSV